MFKPSHKSLQRIKPLLYVLVGSIVLMLSACSNEAYKFKVLCYGGPTNNSGTCSATYTIDNVTSSTLTAAVLDSTGSYVYAIEEAITNDFDDLSVTVTRNLYDTTIVIKVYRDEDIVETTTLSASTVATTTMSTTLYYDYGEDNVTSSISY
ncbi:MAG: hypothetical protein GY754_26365 [bacterium]|nr:hypothetical protein [bacterium]